MKTKATYWIRIEGDLKKSSLVFRSILDMFEEYFSACNVAIKELEFEEEK